MLVVSPKLDFHVEEEHGSKRYFGLVMVKVLQELGEVIDFLVYFENEEYLVE